MVTAIFLETPSISGHISTKNTFKSYNELAEIFSLTNTNVIEHTTSTTNENVASFEQVKLTAAAEGAVNKRLNEAPPRTLRSAIIDI